MRIYPSLFFSLFFFTFAHAQKAWIEPDPTSAAFDPTKEVTIYVDVNKSEFCAALATLPELYMWTWNPNELPAGSPKANGTWTQSNDILKMTNEGNGIFSYKMIPTEFYEVSADVVFDKNFSLLLKGKDGSAGMTTCPEDKTEDLSIEAIPFVLDKKVASFPEGNTKDTMFTRSSDFWTLIYNKNLEEKPALVDATEFYVFIKAVGTDGRTYTYAPSSQISNKPELKMTERESGKYYWTIQPDVFFQNLLPNSVQVKSLVAQIAKKGASSTGDLVDGSFSYHFICN
ncbi:MAG TPA: hypothetical protein PKC40_09260 [Saprospiraceae bacterium]|nr:hypothetical protein [Saprospiraceae bacterium]